MQETFEALLLAVQAGPLEDPPWRTFVARLRGALGGNLANLIFRRAGAGLTEGIAVQDPIPSSDRLRSLYAQHFSAADPIPYFAMEPGCVYAYDELEGIAALPKDPFRDEFLRGADFEHLLIFRVTEPSGCNVWVTITRSRAAAPFDEADRTLCARLARHLAPAVSCHVALLNREIETATYRRAANMLAFGVVALDESGRVVSADEAARRHLERTSELRIVRDRLQSSQADAGLQDCIREALRSQTARPVHLGDAEGLDLLLVPVAPRADLAPGSARVFVYLSGRSRPERDVSVHVAELFGLSGTQARLAVLLARGYALAEAAAAIGITEQSARTYSKEIYARTGTSRQGELIQRILTSVAMLS